MSRVSDLLRGKGSNVCTIDPDAPDGGIRLFGEAEPQAVLEKILYTATRANIAHVWVDGELVSGTAA